MFENRIRPGLFPTASRPLLLILTIICLSGACSGSDAGARHRFTVADVDGIEMAITTGGPKYDGEIFTYEKVREVRGDTTNEASLIYNGLGLRLDEEGNLFIADRGNGRIAMFDREGEFVRGFGREGEGPGEFRWVDILDVCDGIISAWDMRLNRTTRFGVDGPMLDVTTIPYEGRTFGAEMMTGMYLEDSGHRVLVKREGYRGDGTMQSRAMVVGAEFDTLWTVSTPSLQSRYEVSLSSAGRTAGMLVPIEYGPQPFIVYAPVCGLVVSDGDRPELTVYDLDGEISRRIRIELTPERVTTAERGRIVDDMDRQIAVAREVRVADLQARKENLRFAEEKSFWTRLQVDDHGFFWLQVTESNVDRREAGGILWRVLSPEGEYLGDTRWPTTRANCWVTHGHLAFWVDDEETGESFPVLYRIRPAVKGLRYPGGPPRR